MGKPQIEPRILKGFRDYLPRVSIVRREMIAQLEEVFLSFGFAPIDTPALEYTEILLGKGGEETDKQLYRFADNGGRDVALRFDLTVPFARFSALHGHEIGMPFKRYHIAPVWRAEKPQRGRYREFMQCDFDTIGTESMQADAESVLVIRKALRALGVNHIVRLNNRMVLNGFFETLGESVNASSVLRTVDKLEKLGKETVESELVSEAGLAQEQIDQVFSFLDLSRGPLSNGDIIRELKSTLSESSTGVAGVEQLERIFEILCACGVEDSECKLDLSIARGLDYYTGPVFETTLLELPEIGSICSGGRYDNLASLYTKQRLPGVGASIGLDRILGAFEALGQTSERESPAQILIAVLDEDSVASCGAVAQNVRDGGIRAELFSSKAKLGAQIKYAVRKGIPLVLIAGGDELKDNCCAIKVLATGEQVDRIPLEQVVEQANEMLKGTKS